MRHSLRGECGLKYPGCACKMSGDRSLSARRVWIEILSITPGETTGKSLSARRVWIEIVPVRYGMISSLVTLCEESVD